MGTQCRHQSSHDPHLQLFSAYHLSNNSIVLDINSISNLNLDMQGFVKTWYQIKHIEWSGTYSWEFCVCPINEYAIFSMSSHENSFMSLSLRSCSKTYCIHARGKSRGWISQYLRSFGGVRTFSSSSIHLQGWIKKSITLDREGSTVLKSILPCSGWENALKFSIQIGRKFSSRF